MPSANTGLVPAGNDPAMVPVDGLTATFPAPLPMSQFWPASISPTQTRLPAVTPSIPDATEQSPMSIQLICPVRGLLPTPLPHVS